MPEDHAPPVVAVVVASDSGPWLEQTLVSIARQDYDNLTTIVVDAGSGRSLAPRVAKVTPAFYFARLEENRGYGPSANAVLGLAEGAAYYLFCHDDVVLEPGVTRRLVEEAFRSNAGIVGPKLVDPDEPDRILQLGLDMDRFGAPMRRVERREFDQAQHDEAREVFAVPGGCMLVRADLFETIGGFDEQISMFGEDIDLAWRARIAGARVAITPLATVGHLEATAARRRPLPEARALQWRHELRAVLKNYSPTRRSRVVAQLMMLSLLEVVYFAAIGRSRRAREVIDAWRWNFARERDLHEARAEVAKTRRLPDRIVLRLATRSSFRFLRAARSSLEAAVVRHSVRRDMKLHPAGRATEAVPRPRSVTIGAVVAGAVILIGSRLLIVGHLPLIGTYLPLPGPGKLLADYLGGSSGPGNGPVGPVSPAYAFMGLVGLVLGGAMGAVVKLAMVAAVVAGAFGVARLVRPLGSPLARLAAAVAYLFLPLLADDLGRASLPSLAVYGVMPFIVKRLAGTTGLEPYTEGEARLWSRPSARDVLVLGMLVAIAVAFAPSAILAVAACAAGLSIVCALSGSWRAAGRTVVLTVAGGVVAFALCFPWSLTFFQRGASASVLLGTQQTGTGVADLAALARFDLGPIGHSPLAYGLLVASAFVLFVGGARRFAWGARFWGAGVVSLGVAWAAGEGFLAPGGGATRTLITPVAVCVAAAIGLGVASLEGEVTTARFGWRHTASAAFVVIGLLGVLPVLGESPGGRWKLPETGYDAVFSGLTNAKGGLPRGRVLWLGAPGAVPGNGWQLRPGFEEMLSLSLLPSATAIYPSANPGTAREIGGAVADAELGRTVELGALLARERIGAIVVPNSFAPQLVIATTQNLAPPPADLVTALQNQQDLRELPSEGGVMLFENVDLAPSGQRLRPLLVGAVPKGSTPAVLRTLGVALAIAIWFAIAVLAWARRRRQARSRRRHRVPVPATPVLEHPPVLVESSVG
ncbi:MAG: glycosyltransferase family 2 protein [Acidimicrobiales bacterium]